MLPFLSLSFLTLFPPFFFFYKSIFFPLTFFTFFSPFLPSFPTFIFCLYLTIFLFFHLFFLSTCLSFFLPFSPCFSHSLSLFFSFSPLKHLLSARAAASAWVLKQQCCVSQPVDITGSQKRTTEGKFTPWKCGCPPGTLFVEHSPARPYACFSEVASWPGCVWPQAPWVELGS